MIAATLARLASTRPIPWRWATLLAIAFVLGIALSVGMGHPVQNNNEGLYAAIARDMLRSHSWIVPTLDGVPYLEKPPLLYWVTALSYAWFGVSDVSTRAAPMAGLLLVLSAVSWFARREWGERTGLLAVCITASSPLFIGMSRLLMFDLLFTGFYTWALVALYESMARDGGTRWLRASYAALALAVLAKGLVALVFFGLIAVGLAALAPAGRRIARLRSLVDAPGLALFAAIAVPWHVLAWRAEPRFGWFYFVNEHVLRFLDLREPRDYYHGPIWYYLPRVAAAMLPWTGLFLVPVRSDPRDATARRFLVLAFLVPLVFFSLSGAKANYYLVVALPGLAVLLARRIEALGMSWWLAIVPAGWIALFAALACAGPLLASPAHWPRSGASLSAAAISLSVASLALLALRRPAAAMAASATVAIPLALLFSAYLDANEAQNSQRLIAQDIERLGLHDVYTYRDFESISALAYYVDRPIGVIDSSSNDLWFGIRLRPDPARFPSLGRFLATAARPGVAVVTTEARRRELEQGPLGARLTPVAHHGNTWLFGLREDGRRIAARRATNPKSPRG